MVNTLDIAQRQHRELNPIFSLVFTGLVFVYVLSYPPVNFSLMIPIDIRLMIELTILLLLLLILMQKYYVEETLVILFVLPISYLIYLNNTESGRNTLSALNKIIFMVIYIKLLMQHHTMCKYAKKAWVLLWSAFAIISFISLLGYMSGLVNFIYLPSELIYNEEYFGYYYFHNPILGNILVKSFFGIEIPRILVHMTEPIHIAFFFGWNVIISKDLIDDPVKAKHFMILNLLAGFFTISMAYMLLMLFFVLPIIFVKKYVKNKNAILLYTLLFFIFPLLFIVFVFFGTSIVDSTSFDNRMVRFSYVIPVLEKSSLSSLLFGIGVGNFMKFSGGFAPSSFLGILLERGLVMFVFIICLFTKYTKHNLILLCYLFAYLMVCHITWYPIFILSLVIGYVSYYSSHSRNIVVDQSGSDRIISAVT